MSATKQEVLDAHQQAETHDEVNQEIVNAVTDHATEVMGLGILVELNILTEETMRDFVADLFKKDGLIDAIEDKLKIKILRSLAADHPPIQELLDDISRYREGDDVTQNAILIKYNIDQTKKNETTDMTQQESISSINTYPSSGYEGDSEAGSFFDHSYLTTPITTVHKQGNMTYCSKSIRESAALFGLSVARGNSANESFDLDIIAKQHLIAEEKFDYKKHNLAQLSTEELYNIWSKHGSDNIFMDIKLHSTTKNGSKYGHRAAGVMIDGEAFLIDGYYTYNGKKRNTLIPISEIDQKRLSLAEINYYTIPETNMSAALDGDHSTVAEQLVA